MKLICLSAANIMPAREHSASVRVCHMAGELVQAEQPGVQVSVVPMIDYEMKPCIMCGDCVHTQRCSRDAGFNQIFEQLLQADGLMVVVPHYAPLPSKLMILLEKMQEMAFLGWSAHPETYRFGLAGKPLGVIGHGGQTAPEAAAYYQKALVEPVAMAAAGCGLRVIDAAEGVHGVSFGIRAIRQRSDSIFVEIEHDWDEIRQRITPLARNMAAALAA